MPNGDPPQIALVGCGSLSTRAYLPTLRLAHRTGRCRFVALCDLNADLLAQRAGEYRPRRSYTDIDELLDAETLDGILLVVPVSVTPVLAAKTLRRSLPTYLEKPPGRSAAECRSLIRIAARGDVPNQVAFNRRYAPPLRLLREEALRFGPIHSASAVMFRHRRVEPSFGWSTAIHTLDALRFLAGDVARAAPRTAQLPKSTTTSYIVDLEYVSGGIGTFEILPDTGVSMERYTVHGPETTGLAQIAGPGSCVDFPGTAQLYHQRKAVPLPNPFGRKRRISIPEACGFRHEILAFLDCLRARRVPTPSLAESLQSLQVVEAISRDRGYRSKQ